MSECDNCHEQGVETHRMRNGKELCEECKNNYINKEDDYKEDMRLRKRGRKW